jgi:hypothetical protein
VISVVGALLLGEISWISHVVFPVGLGLGVLGLLLSTAWLIRMRWQPRERESSAHPLAGIVVACGMLLAAAHLQWTDRPFQLDDAWPSREELPIYVRVYGNQTEIPASLEFLELTPPVHADVEKIRRMRFCDGRLEAVGIQFRSATARRRWQESEESKHQQKPEGRWTFRRAGGASLLLLIEGAEKPDPMIRDLMKATLGTGIGRAIDRESNRPGDQARNR